MTTYRHMAEDCVDNAITLGPLDERPCRTHNLPIHGYTQDTFDFGHLNIYGSLAEPIHHLATTDLRLSERLHPALPYIAAEVVWATRHELARTIEDVLARRTRALFLNAHAAIAMARPVATLMAEELHKPPAWIESQVATFTQLAKLYTIPSRQE